MEKSEKMVWEKKKNSTNISTNIDTAMRLVVVGANANDYLRTSAVWNINS